MFKSSGAQILLLLLQTASVFCTPIACEVLADMRGRLRRWPVRAVARCWKWPLPGHNVFSPNANKTQHPETDPITQEYFKSPTIMELLLGQSLRFHVTGTNAGLEAAGESGNPTTTTISISLGYDERADLRPEKSSSCTYLVMHCSMFADVGWSEGKIAHNHYGAPTAPTT